MRMLRPGKDVSFVTRRVEEFAGLRDLRCFGKERDQPLISSPCGRGVLIIKYL